MHSELVGFNTPAAELKRYKALVISGGPDSVYSDTAPKCDSELFKLGIPILGICYGLQMMAHEFNGKIEKKDLREDGVFDLTTDENSPIYAGLGASVEVLLTHGDSVTAAPDGWTVSSRSPAGLIASMECPEKKMYGLQFHPEVDLTPRGKEIFSNFLFKIAGVVPGYTRACRKEKAIKEIREKVGNKTVLSLVSGGVDSSVCTALLKLALPAEQIVAVHVDNGFMRQDESSAVKEALGKVGVNVTVVQGAERFYNATTDVRGETTLPLKIETRPEYKRKIIGDTFMHVADEEAKRQGLKFEEMILAQGTLRPDLIESASKIASGTADVIKTHHNDTALVRQLRSQGRVVEPLCDYHKDEVRQLGKELGLPDHLVMRQPFPGPGLAIRILCTNEPFVTENDDSIVAKLRKFESDKVKACLMPFRTVGVQGDARTYSHCVALTQPEKPDWKFLLGLAKEIPKACHGVNRVVYLHGDTMSGKVTTITKTTCTPDVIAQLQQADYAVNQILYKYNLTRKLAQCPVVLTPCGFGTEGNRSIIVRTFLTNDFMTGIPATVGEAGMPTEAWCEIVNDVLKVPGISRVGFDLTAKPPGTTEWE